MRLPVAAASILVPCLALTLRSPRAPGARPRLEAIPFSPESPVSCDLDADALAAALQDSPITPLNRLCALGIDGVELFVRGNCRPPDARPSPVIAATAAAAPAIASPAATCQRTSILQRCQRIAGYSERDDGVCLACRQPFSNIRDQMVSIIWQSCAMHSTWQISNFGNT